MFYHPHDLRSSTNTAKGNFNLRKQTRNIRSISQKIEIDLGIAKIVLVERMAEIITMMMLMRTTKTRIVRSRTMRA